MIRLAANLSFLFPELPFVQRIDAAAQAGFRAVEWAFAYEIPTEELARALQRNQLDLVIINTPAGDSTRGDMGMAGLPGRQKDFEAAFDQALASAVALKARLIHVLVGAPPTEVPAQVIDSVVVENVARAAERAAHHDITLTLEPLNARDRPAYHLHTVDHALRLIQAIQCPNIKLQLDLYHQQVTGGDVIRTIERVFDSLAHVQIAGVPDRTEPALGELAFDRVLARLDALGYLGFVGCEYTPAAGTVEGLAWAQLYLEKSS